MDPYTSERVLLDRHRQVIRAAERRARLTPEGDAPAGVRTWAACRLRLIADRLEGGRHLHRA